MRVSIRTHARVNVPVLRPVPEHLFGFVPGGLPHRYIIPRARARVKVPDAAKLVLTNFSGHDIIAEALTSRSATRQAAPPQE